MHLNGNFFEKVDILNTVEANSYVKPNETMAKVKDDL